MKGYRFPRIKVIKAPKDPIIIKPTINKPAGEFDPDEVDWVKVGIFKGGGDVKVGKCVGSSCTPKAATYVGSSVGVVRGVEVGGLGIWGKVPEEIET